MYATYLNDGVVLQNSLTCKIIAALITGTLGAVLSNPVDVVKVRSMVDPHLYPNTIVAFRAIYEKEHWQGFYKGFVPSALRAAFISVGTVRHSMLYTTDTVLYLITLKAYIMMVQCIMNG